jgi:hypothetical protein
MLIEFTHMQWGSNLGRAEGYPDASRTLFCQRKANRRGEDWARALEAQRGDWP